MASGNKFFQPDVTEAPAGVDRRGFLMCSAAIGKAAVLTGCTAEEKTKQVGAAAPTVPIIRSILCGNLSSQLLL